MRPETDSAMRLNRTFLRLGGTSLLMLGAMAWASPLDDAPKTDVVSTRHDEQPVEIPSSKVTRIAVDASTLRVTTDGELASFDVLELERPPRLAIDLNGLTSAVRTPRSPGGIVRDVRVAEHEGKVRIVLEFTKPTSVDVRRRAHGLTAHFVSAPKEQEKPRTSKLIAAPVAAPRPTPPLVPASASPRVSATPPLPDSKIPLASVAAISMEMAALAAVKAEPNQASREDLAEITSVRFLESASGGTVELTLSGKPDFRVDRVDSKGAVLNLENVRIGRALEKNLDTSALKTPIKTVSVFSVPGPRSRVRVAVAAAAPIEQSVTRKGNTLSWRFAALPQPSQMVTATETAPATAEIPSTAIEANDPTPRFDTTRRVTFEFKDIEIHNLLRMLADISKKNIIVTDDVSGKVTLRLRNVPWRQALDLVLRAKGLGKEEFGNIIRVAPLATLEAEAKSRAEHEKANRQAVPLTVNLIPINYATADSMEKRVKEVLSERGSVTTDTRTNTLIVREIPENMTRIRSLVASLDLATPQVLIEARIVEANVSFSRAIGIQWGGQANASTGTGNPTGLTFPNSISLTGGSSNNSYLGNTSNPNYAVSLPVGVGDGSGGALGLVLGSAGSAAVLNMRLSASETNGTIKTISAPKVATLDNTTARISQGVSIPYSQTSAAGVNTAFVEARLSLDVTPHITRDGSVLMQVSAQNNQPDYANSGANGQPGISKKEASTNVMVRDGETTVIGGIYVRSGSSTENGVPFLNRIPILGFFFRRNSQTEQKTELLIFITPRILNQSPVQATAAQ